MRRKWYGGDGETKRGEWRRADGSAKYLKLMSFKVDDELTFMIRLRATESGKTLTRYMNDLLIEHMRGWKSERHSDVLDEEIKNLPPMT